MKSAVAAAAITIPTYVHSRVFGANDRINAAVLGVNGRGQNTISGFMGLDNVEVTTLVDPDLNITSVRAREFEEKYGRNVKVVQDLRNTYDDKDIDVVGIATPNHWHSLATIWA
ncbi:MAG: Gfo/Idh/MocA family oxidoreductase [Bacteroidales bacterium]